jgi:hypothetical protein
MLYLSQVLGRPIYDAGSDRIATISDILVRYGDDDHPPVIGIVARLRRRDFFISNANISELGENGVRMNSAVLDPDALRTPRRRGFARKGRAR